MAGKLKDGSGDVLMVKPGFPPRGGDANAASETAPRGRWQNPHELGTQWDYEAGVPRAVLLGRHGTRRLGRIPEGHIVTIAGSRAGKSRTVLMPNLREYPGSVVVIDPKGELTKETAGLRQDMGQDVYVLDPFNAVGYGSHGHNPCAELLNSPQETLSADAAQLADALIIDNPRDPHWTDSAKNLITGLVLHTITTQPQSLSIANLRAQLSGVDELPGTLEDMTFNENLGGIIQNVGRSVLGKFTLSNGHYTPSDEMRSILSTVLEQTRPLDDLGAVFGRHDFNFKDIARKEKPSTIYLILPATRIATHARWLRLFVYQLMAAIERNPIPRDRTPMLLILEEFAALGYMRALESAAGYFAGYGVKLWTILQDLTQIKTHYRNSWETFIGNASIIQAFGNVDATTTKYLSDMLGQTTIMETQQHFVSPQQRAAGNLGTQRTPRSVPFLTPTEITFHFAASTGRQLVLVPGELPVYMDRMKPDV